jgi:putative ABC transport system substrate-binding protein
VALLIGPAENDIEAQRRIAAFRERMQSLGWVDGRNVRFDYRWATAMPTVSPAMRRSWSQRSPT